MNITYYICNMKKLLLILLCLPMIGFGQGWEKTFNNSEGKSVKQTIDNGYVIAGISDTSISLLKTDGNGNQMWWKNYGFGSAKCVQQTNDGGYIISGYREYYGNFLIKTDNNGDEIWNQTIGIGGGRSVQQTSDGGYITIGHSLTDTVNWTVDAFLYKTDANGNIQWFQNYGTIGNEYPLDVKQTVDGGYIITGSSDAIQDGLLLIKTDGNGNQIWNYVFGGNLGDEGTSVQQTSDGGYIIVGTITPFLNGDDNVYLIKTDVSGNELWAKTFGGTDDDRGYSVQQTSDGGYIIVGRTRSFCVDYCSEVYLIKTDNNGNEQWNETYSFKNYNSGLSVQQTIDGGFIIAGGTSNGQGDGDMYLIKTDGNGNISSTFNIPINPNRKLQNTVDILGRETKQTNQPLFYIYDDGTVEKKITIE